MFSLFRDEQFRTSTDEAVDGKNGGGRIVPSQITHSRDAREGGIRLHENLSSEHNLVEVALAHPDDGVFHGIAPLFRRTNC